MNSVVRCARIELAKRTFWEFEQALFPDFFLDDRKHLKLLADTLQDLYEGNIKNAKGDTIRRLMINMPPRHAKSFTLILFCQWILGKENTNRVITVSYNETLSSRFSKAVRDSIDTVNLEEDKIGFQDIFHEVVIKKGDGSNSLWSLEGQFFNYLGTGMGGTITGIGCNVGIIDDPIKNDKEAFNDRVLEEHWNFYVDTFLSRLESGAIQIINMTRWATKDLCGKLLELEPEKWKVLKLEAYDSEKDEMLCESLLNKEDYLDKKSKTSPAIFSANYHQEPVDEQGRMYKEFKTYKELPEGGERLNYTDTADEGKDYLCSINYLKFEDRLYVLDILYTKAAMEETEPATAELLTKWDIQKTKIESNNGGRGFARNVRKALRDNGNAFTIVKWFHQTQNKKARIFSQSHWVQENVYYPHRWNDKYPEFYKSMVTYKKEGKNKHDDAQDCLTGCAEQVNRVKRTFK